MDLLRRLVLVTLTCSLGASCSSAPEQPEPLGDSFLAAMKERTECVDAWTGLLDEWKQNGGGILGSMASTRDQLAKDQHSAFARIVRDAWKKQDKPVSGHLGDWPVPSGSSRSVRLSIDASGFVPEACEAPIWLDDWLFFEILTDRDHWTVRKLPEMPSDLDVSDHYAGSSWLFYWLFARVDTAPKLP
jgi:hypothetical protein